MLHSAKKRIWPSRSSRACWNMRRQPLGETNGRMPSTINTSASAAQRVSLSNTLPYLREAGAAVPGGPRIALKNSDDGSSTITSALRLKLVL